MLKILLLVTCLEVNSCVRVGSALPRVHVQENGVPQRSSTLFIMKTKSLGESSMLLGLLVFHFRKEKLCV